MSLKYSELKWDDIRVLIADVATETELKSWVSTEIATAISGVRHVGRWLEKLTTHTLLTILFPEGYQLVYTENGKPYLVDSAMHISISHSHGKVAVAIAPYNIGIDIQKADERLSSLRTRFLRTDESIDPQRSLLHLTLHWSAKEAVYKWISRLEVGLKEHIRIIPFVPSSSEGSFDVETFSPETVTLQAYYWILGEFVLVAMRG